MADAQEDTEALCARMAATTVSSSAKGYGVILDYSVESLEKLESVLQQMYEENQAIPISEQGLQVRSLALGAYIGEVMRKSASCGNWVRNSQFGENTFLLSFGGLQQTFPVRWAYTRIVTGPSESVVFKAKAVLSMVSGNGPLAGKPNIFP
jgi:hypothetical protein